jgi:hypothetical protein
MVFVGVIDGVGVKVGVCVGVLVCVGVGQVVVETTFNNLTPLKGLE